MQMNLLRKVSLLEFRAASSSNAVKPTPSVRIGFGRAGAAGQLPDLRPVDEIGQEGLREGQGTDTRHHEARKERGDCAEGQQDPCRLGQLLPMRVSVSDVRQGELVCAQSPGPSLQQEEPKGLCAEIRTELLLGITGNGAT